MQPLPQIPPGWLPADTEPEWERLDAHQRADVLRRLRLVALIEQEYAGRRGKMTAIERAALRAKEAQLGARGRDGSTKRNGGLGRLALYRLHCAWESSGGNWAGIARYGERIKDKTHALRATKLSVKRVKAFLRRNGRGAAWCTAHGINPRALHALLAPHRSGEPAALAAARAIRDAIRQRVAAIQKQLGEDRQERAALDRSIAAAEAELREIGEDPIARL